MTFRSGGFFVARPPIEHDHKSLPNEIMTDWIFWAVGLALYLSLIGAILWIAPRWLDNRFGKHEKHFGALVMKSEKTFTDLEAELAVYKQINEVKERENGQLRLESSRCTERLEKQMREHEALKQEVGALRGQLEAKNVIDKEPERMAILAIWPTPPGQPPLDQSAESDALYNAGYTYTALRGPRANRAGVILELDRVRPTIIQVGSHGNDEGILLSDGNAEPGWWGRVVDGKEIQLILLLSCDSSQQDEINVSDALVREGVKAVISCDSKIDDGDAVKFAELLYAKLSEGEPLATAVNRAKLGVSRRAAEMIRLREGR